MTTGGMFFININYKDSFLIFRENNTFYQEIFYNILFFYILLNFFKK